MIVRLYFLMFLVCSSYLVQSQSLPAWSRDNVNAVLWQQKSAEYRALCFQAYNIATWRIDQMKGLKASRPRCVVVDIDETVLDNSPFQGYEVAKGVSYDQNDWLQWTSKAQADTVPGALSFLKYATNKGFSVFYITNRLRTEQDATLKNLQAFGFPFADYKHVLPKEETSDKESRRNLVAKKYEISLLCGDNLNDFTDLFYKKDQIERAAAGDKVRAMFGRRFIVLPNPMYGDWEAPVYGDKKNLTNEEKGEIRLKALKGY